MAPQTSTKRKRTGMMSRGTHTFRTIWIDAFIVIVGGSKTPRVEMTMTIHIPNKIIAVKRRKSVDCKRLWA
jgi:hypothetical protein